MSIINKRRGVKASHNSSKKELTTKEFLGKDGDTTYIRSNVLIDFVDNGRIEDVQGMETLIQLCQERIRMVYNRNVRKDAGGNDYLYLNFYRPNAIEGVKAVLLDNLKQFLEDFSNGKFSVNFTLEDLVAEAEKEN